MFNNFIFTIHFSFSQGTSESDENSNSSTRRRRRENNNTLLTSKTLSFENSTDDDENSNGFDVVGPTTRKQWSEWVAKPKSPTGGAPSPEGREKENQVSRSIVPLITGYFVLWVAVFKYRSTKKV